MFVPGRPFQPSPMFEGRDRDKHSSLLAPFVNYARKKFYDTGNRVAMYCAIHIIVDHLEISFQWPVL